MAIINAICSIEPLLRKTTIKLLKRKGVSKSKIDNYVGNASLSEQIITILPNILDIKNDIKDKQLFEQIDTARKRRNDAIHNAVECKKEEADEAIEAAHKLCEKLERIIN